jgi:opacity protein-like surface antigen
LQLGYGKWIPHTSFYLGLELFGNLSQRHADSSPNANYTLPPGFVDSVNANLDTDSHVKLDDAEWGLDLRPGFMLTPRTLFYGRVGMAFNHMQLKSSADLNLTAPGVGNNASSSIFVKDSKNVTALRLGAGLEQLITPHIAINADYIYTNYGSIEANGIADVNNPDGTVRANTFVLDTEATVRTHAVMLGVHYYPVARKGHKSLVKMDPENVERFNGIYAGARAGILHTNVNEDIDTTTDTARLLAPSNIAQLSQTDRLFRNSGIGGVFLGYGQLLGRSPYYAGIEVFTDVAKRETNSSHGSSNFSDPTDSRFSSALNTETNVKLNPVDVGVDTRLGRLITDSTLFYGRAGISFNRVEVTSHNNLTLQYPTIPQFGTAVSALNETENKNVAGLRLGLGLEQMIGENLAITADYIYTYYGHVGTNFVGDTTGVGFNARPITQDGFVNDTRVKVSTQAATLGLAYHF